MLDSSRISVFIVLEIVKRVSVTYAPLQDEAGWCLNFSSFQAAVKSHEWCLELVLAVLLGLCYVFSKKYITWEFCI